MYKITYCSLQGKGRDNNEDAFLINDIISKECGNIQIDTNYIIAAVADGIGGYKKGEIASFIVLNTLGKDKPKNLNELVASLLKAKDRLNDIAFKDNIKLGTTIAGVLGTDEELLAFNVGDCRVYKITSTNKVILLTKDHTLAKQLQDLGIDKSTIKEQANILTSAIVGGIKEEDFEIFYTKLKLDLDDKIIICSDGFWKVFENDIVKIINKRNKIKTLKKYIKYKNIKLDDDATFIIIKKEKKENLLKSLLVRFKNLIKRRENEN